MQSAIARSWDAMRGAVLGLAQAPPKPCAPDIADGTGVVIWRASRGHAEAELDVALPEPEAERVYEGTGLLETGLWAHASHLFSCGRYREAIQVWQELAPSSRRIGASTLHFCMGCAELKLGDVESAQRAFATAYSEGYLRLELITERVVDSLRDAPGFGKVEHWFDRL